jgi:hypothetical protein
MQWGLSRNIDFEPLLACQVGMNPAAASGKNGSINVSTGGLLRFFEVNL